MVTHLMLDSVISNSISLTSWKCDRSVTLLFDTSLAGNGWDWQGTGCSVGILGLSSVFSFTLSRKWKVYVGGSLSETKKNKMSTQDAATRCHDVSDHVDTHASSSLRGTTSARDGYRAHTLSQNDVSQGSIKASDLVQTSSQVTS